MRFELNVAFKYLIPRWRQLSVSIISLISILVISLVVWLVVLFLSVTEGVEKKWIDQLLALNAPVRMTPTEAYYQSYYYQIDNLSLDSNYTTKTIGEKLFTSQSDPYDPTFDMELPSNFPLADRHHDGSLIDPVKEAWDVIAQLPNARPQEYEVSIGNLRLSVIQDQSETFLNQASYIASFDGENPRLQRMILSPSNEGPYWVQPDCGSVPCDTPLGDGILIAKHFQNNGVHLGDRGYIAYFSQTASSMQEQRVPVYVAGFYDPGMMPFGNKLIFVDPKITALLRGNMTIADTTIGNGVNIWLHDIKDAQPIKDKLIRALDSKGIRQYWDVQSYQDYELTKPMLEQLQSDKNLFTLIAVIILLVACSNIISMLILLVNDKKKEIGIMQSMGASPKRIAIIFGICGFVMGLISSIIGTFAAVLTLRHLQSLIDMLSFFQGHEAFQAAFYGSQLPNELSYQSLTFVIVTTLFISLIAGLIPAIKAAKIRPSEILRSE